MRLSKHFREKWVDFMGYEPTESEIERILGESICVQKFKTIRQKESMFIVPSIFWDIQRNLILKVDELNNTVITVYAERRPK